MEQINKLDKLDEIKQEKRLLLSQIKGRKEEIKDTTLREDKLLDIRFLTDDLRNLQESSNDLDDILINMGIMPNDIFEALSEEDI